MSKFNKVSELKNPYEDPNFESKEGEHIEEQDVAVSVSNKYKDKKVPFSISITRTNEEYIEKVVRQGINRSEFVNSLIDLARLNKIKIKINIK